MSIDNLNIAITATSALGSVTIGNVAYLSKQLSAFDGLTLALNQSPRSITLGPPDPKIVYIQNLKSNSGDLVIDSVSDFSAFPQIIHPGDNLCICPKGTFYAAFLSGSGNMWIMSDTNITLGVPPGLYIQFDVNWHDAASIGNGADLIHIGDASNLTGGNFVAVFPATFSGSGVWQFWSDAPPSGFINVPVVPVLDTWTTLGMFIQDNSGNLTLTPYVDGTPYTSYNAGTFSVTGLYFGAIFSGVSNNHELRNLTIGTTGFGSTDLFAADGSSLVPPFDSSTGTGISSTGTTIQVINSGTDAYGVKATSTWP